MTNGETLEELRELWKKEEVIAEAKYRKTWEKVLNTGEEKYLTKYLHDYIKLCHEQNEKPWMWTTHEWEVRHTYWEKTQIHMKHLQDKSRCKWVWITINLPPHEERLSFLQQGISKLFKRKCITELFTKGWYVYEQRQPNDNGDRGEHIHMLLKQHSEKMWPKEYIRTLAKDFNCKEESINIGDKYEKLFKEEYKAQEKLNYILGWKGTEEKRLKQKEDISWRLENNLKPYYEIAGTKTSPLVVPDKH